jgi:hypothetical protein
MGMVAAGTIRHASASIFVVFDTLIATPEPDEMVHTLTTSRYIVKYADCRA